MNVRPMLSGDALAAAAADNFAVHCAWPLQQMDGATVLDNPDLMVVDSGLGSDTFNAVCRARLAALQAHERIMMVIEHFAQAARPFSWWVSPGDMPVDLGARLLDAGLLAAETELAMTLALQALRPLERLPDGLEIRRVRTEAELHAFATVVAANWTPPDAEVLRFYAKAAPALLNQAAPLWLYVGFVDGNPVATAEQTVAGGVVGLYNICTLEAFRQRGIGTAMTVRPLLDARLLGWQTAVLQASAAGTNLYRRVGFHPFGSITEYKPASD